jgi:transcriptional regulator with XRE-family HTH domain
VGEVGNVRLKGLWNTAWAAEVVSQRVAARLTQQQVWTRAGIARSTYTKFETDRTTLTVDQLGAIADAIGVPIDELARGARIRREHDLAAADPAADTAARRLAVLASRLAEADPEALTRLCGGLETLIAETDTVTPAPRGRETQLPVVPVPAEDIALLIRAAHSPPQHNENHGTPST